MRRGRVGVSLFYLAFGLTEATWVSRIPAIQQKLHVDTGTLGVALLGSAVGAIVSMPLTGAMLARGATRRVLVAAALLYCGALTLLSLAGSAGMLMTALMVFGAIGGALNVAVNAAGAEVDKLSPKPVMSSFHALFSMGGMLGAGAGALAVRWGAPVGGHFVGAALVLGLLALCSAPLIREGEAAEAGGGFVLPPRSLFGIGALAFCILFGERAMADWTGIYLVQRGATNSFAAAGFACFAAAMTVGRLCGDWSIHRFGPVAVVRAGSGFAACGLAVALTVGTSEAGLFGFFCVGAGFSIIVPILFRAGAQTPGMAAGAGIAAVSTLGFLGFLTGPPLVGFLARGITLRWSLGTVAILSAVVCLSAGPVLRRNRLF